MAGNTLVHNMISYLPSLESVRALTALAQQGASLVPKKNIQDMLFKATSGLLLGTQIEVVGKALQGFSQKIEVTKQPAETKTTARLQRVAELLIASSVGTLFVISQQAGDKLRTAVQIAGIATGLGIAFRDNKRELTAARERVEYTMPLELEQLRILQDQLSRVQNTPTRPKLEITYEAKKSYEEKKGSLISQLTQLIDTVQSESWAGEDEFGVTLDPVLLELQGLLEKVQDFKEGTTVDMTKQIQGKPFRDKLEKYKQKLEDLIAAQGRVEDQNQKTKNIKDLKKLQKDAELFTEVTGVPNTIVYGRDELPTSIFYGEQGTLPESVSFQGIDYPIEYPSQNYEERQKFAIQHIQSYIDAFVSTSIEPNAKILESLRKQKEGLGSIYKESKMPKAIELTDSTNPSKIISAPVDYNAVFHSFIDTNSDKHLVAIPVDYILNYRFAQNRLLDYEFTNIQGQKQTARIEIDYKTDTLLDIQKKIFSDKVDQLIGFIEKGINAKGGAEAKKEYAQIKGIFNQRKAITVTVAALSTLVVLAQTFTKTNASAFRYSANFTLGAQLAWSIGSLVVSLTENTKKKEGADKEARANEVVKQAHTAQAKAILEKRISDLEKCRDKVRSLEEKLKDPKNQNVVTEKTKYRLDLPSLNVTHIDVKKGVPQYATLKAEVEKLIAKLEPLTKETVEAITAQKVSADVSVQKDEVNLVNRAAQLRRAQAVAFAFSGVLPILERAFPKATYLAPIAKVASLVSIGLTFVGAASTPAQLRKLGESALSPVSLFVGIR